MRIATTYENGAIFAHFGRTAQFKLYDVADGAVQSTAILSTGGDGHSLLADLLKRENVDTLICGGIGEGAKNLLHAAGIRLYGGVSGDADAAVAALLKNALAYNPAAQCSHHGEHEGCHSDGHSCGGHAHG